MSYELLTFIWFVLLGVLLTGYAILDGSIWASASCTRSLPRMIANGDWS